MKSALKQQHPERSYIPPSPQLPANQTSKVAAQSKPRGVQDLKDLDEVHNDEAMRATGKQKYVGQRETNSQVDGIHGIAECENRT